MATKSNSSFTINGVIDTNKSVMKNIDTIASAAGSWVTYDINQGKWAVVINQPGSSVKSFDDSNIIGSINISGTGIMELYNKVEFAFPNKDILDQYDTISIEIPSGDRFPNEPDNTLNYSIDCINDPVQANMLASRELKQSRVDKIIQFRTDFSALGLKAGDLIDVTSEVYDYTNKVFRIVSISEEDSDDNNIVLSITALEYDSDVYNDSGLTRTAKETNTGIISKCQNTTVQSSDNQAGLPLDLSDYAKALGLLLTFNSLTGKYELSQGSPVTTLSGVSGVVISWTFSDGQDLDIRARIIEPFAGQYGVDDYLGWTGDGASTTQWPLSGSPIIQWGGDNTGTGQEAILLDIGAFRTYYPSNRYCIIECRGNWYNTPGFNPVYLQASMYQGGTFGSSGFTFENTGYTTGRTLDGLKVYVSSNSTNPQTLGDLMGYFVFDVQTSSGQFTLDLTPFQ